MKAVWPEKEPSRSLSVALWAIVCLMAFVGAALFFILTPTLQRRHPATDTRPDAAIVRRLEFVWEIDGQDRPWLVGAPVPFAQAFDIERWTYRGPAAGVASAVQRFEARSVASRPAGGAPEHLLRSYHVIAEGKLEAALVGKNLNVLAMAWGNPDALGRLHHHHEPPLFLCRMGDASTVRIYWPFTRQGRGQLVPVKEGPHSRGAATIVHEVRVGSWDGPSLAIGVRAGMFQRGAVAMNSAVWASDDPAASRPAEPYTSAQRMMEAYQRTEGTATNVHVPSAWLAGAIQAERVDEIHWQTALDVMAKVPRDYFMGSTSFRCGFVVWPTQVGVPFWVTFAVVSGIASVNGDEPVVMEPP